MKTHLLAAAALLLSCAAACGARTQPLEGSCDTGAADLECVLLLAADPCSPPQLVAPRCDASAGILRCPAGTRPYARSPSPPATCLPFSDPAGPLRSLGGSLVRVPTDDGRCLWIAEQVATNAGQTLHNVALETDRTAAFGTCPTRAAFAGGALTSAVHVEGGDDPTLLVQIASAYRFAGATHVVYRLFKVDPTAAFGVTYVGGGLGRWDPSTVRIVVPGPNTLPFSAAFDLGDAALALPDHAYVWGCGRHEGLTQGCLVARFNALSAMQVFAGSAGWTGSPDGKDAATVFESGPWVSSVVPSLVSGDLLHVYASGFGSALQTHVATAPEGPWTASASLGACSLPGDDAHAFCAGPVVHTELADPTHPGEVVVSYGVGTTAPDGAARKSARPAAYWTRLAWMTAP